MSVIVGVHGLANKPPAETLKEGWHNAIVEGLRKNRNLAASPKFASVYWADVMYAEPILDDQQPYRAAGGPLKRYKDSWFDDVVAGVLDIGGSVIDAAKELTGMTDTANHVLEGKLPDLDRYYQQQDIRTELRRRLKETLQQNRSDRTMVIAHSMGSIIAYDVLREIGREDPNYRVGHFVTIGSPLGLPHVKFKIREENPLVRTPSVVEQWTNFADRRDPVAFDVYLSNDYEPNDRGVRVHDDLVINDYGGINHKSYGYLRAPEVTDVIRKFL